MTQKIAKKPTPAQARIIRALRDYPELKINLGNWKPIYSGGSWNDRRYCQLEAIPYRRSIKAMEREGWLEYEYWREYKRPISAKVTEAGIEAIKDYVDEDFETPAPTITADTLLDVIERKHEPPQWIFLRELRLGTGYKQYYAGSAEIDPYQRIDAFAMHCYPSKKWHRIAYEVKISRGDFLHEIKNPDKREPALRFSNLFYFVTPVGLVERDEIPEGLGLIEVHGDLFSKEVVKATWRMSEKPTWSFMASVARSLSGAQNEYKLTNKLAIERMEP